MSQDLINQGAQLLEDVASAAATASKAQPTDASVMSEELALDPDLGDADFPVPYGFGHALHRMLVYAAGERLATLSWTVKADPYPHVMSASELARAAAEAASTSIWLGAEEADGTRRLRRMLGILSKSSKEEYGLRRELGLEYRESGTDVALNWGARQGVKPDKPMPYTEMLLYASPTTGKGDYRRLSAVAHSTAYAIVGTWMEVVQAQNGNLGPIRVHALMAAAAATRYVIFATGGAVRTVGGSDQHIDRLTQRLEELESATFEFGEGMDWDFP